MLLDAVHFYKVMTICLFIILTSGHLESILLLQEETERECATLGKEFTPRILVPSGHAFFPSPVFLVVERAVCSLHSVPKNLG